MFLRTKSTAPVDAIRLKIEEVSENNCSGGRESFQSLANDSAFERGV
jgi:hypothetical protein